MIDLDQIDLFSKGEYLCSISNFFIKVIQNEIFYYLEKQFQCFIFISIPLKAVFLP